MQRTLDSATRTMAVLAVAGWLAACGCAAPEDEREAESAPPLTGVPTPTDATGDASSDGSLTATSQGTAGSDVATEDDESGGGPKLDVGPEVTTGGVCPPDDACCNMEVPPHELLDAFLLAYPPANMPKSVAAIQAFMPEADGHMMAWSDENVGDEIIDTTNGGVIEANIEAGRAVSRAAAETAIPAGGVVVEAREEPVIIEVLAGDVPCNAVGWGWGSILFEDVDGSIGELVYLYIGYCAEPDGDIEAFFYSDQSVQICEPPG